MSHQEEQSATKKITPYEAFLKSSLDDSKKQLDELYNEFAKANILRKRSIKREIEIVNQNIEITSKDLQKYVNAMSWLREPTHERDEKAEELKKVPVDEEKAAAPAAKPAVAPVARPTPTTVAKPTVSTPAVAQPRPTSTPVAKPTPVTSTPVAKPVAKPAEEEKKESA